MASPAASLPSGSGVVRPPDPEPQAIRACLTSEVAAAFDEDWKTVLGQVAHTQDLGAIRTLLEKWRHFAYAELTDPGSYFRTLATASHILARGARPDAVSGDELKAHIQARLRES